MTGGSHSTPCASAMVTAGAQKVAQVTVAGNDGMPSAPVPGTAADMAEQAQTLAWEAQTLAEDAEVLPVAPALCQTEGQDAGLQDAHLQAETQQSPSSHTVQSAPDGDEEDCHPADAHRSLQSHDVQAFSEDKDETHVVDQQLHPVQMLAENQVPSQQLSSRSRTCRVMRWIGCLRMKKNLTFWSSTGSCRATQ